LHSKFSPFPSPCHLKRFLLENTKFGRTSARSTRGFTSLSASNAASQQNGSLTVHVLSTARAVVRLQVALTIQITGRKNLDPYSSRTLKLRDRRRALAVRVRIEFTNFFWSIVELVSCPDEVANLAVEPNFFALQKVRLYKKLGSTNRSQQTRNSQRLHSRWL